MRTRLGRIIRDVQRKIVGRAELEAVFAWPLSCASQIRSQQQRQRGWKLYSFHALRWNASARARPARPTSSALRHPSSAPMPARRAASSYCMPRLSGNPYDGHTWQPSLRGPKSSQAVRWSAPMSTRATAVTKRRTTPCLHLRSEARRVRRHQARATTSIRIEAAIGHMKNDGHLGRCYLKGRDGDAANAILTAVGYNFRLLLAWLRILCA